MRLDKLKACVDIGSCAILNHAEKKNGLSAGLASYLYSRMNLGSILLPLYEQGGGWECMYNTNKKNLIVCLVI